MKSLKMFIALGFGILIGACTSAGTDDIDSSAGGENPPVQDQPTPPAPSTDALSFDESASLLLQGTFGASMQDITAVENNSASNWLQAQFDEPATLHLPRVLTVLPGGLVTLSDGSLSPYADHATVDSIMDAAVKGDDQLRQRMAYALSQIVVVSGISGTQLHRQPHVEAAYFDILVRNAFGNYRDILEEVTYSPAMAKYLTYLRGKKANPTKGSVPDENYAREVMQLFTIGLVELNMDGTPRLQNGQTIETYTNDDIVGLARVFTGFSYDDPSFWPDLKVKPELAYAPLRIFPEHHSTAEKSFLGATIPAGTSGPDSVDRALDVLFNHPNVAPFISQQLIQRFVTSNPKPAYVERVARVFENGSFTMPNGVTVGEGRRGDLKATIAAILLDNEARTPSLRDDVDFGRVREPYLRFVHWARTFNVNSAVISSQALLWNPKTSGLSQQPLRSPSVFNFYRPGYTAPGTMTGDANLVAPELQILDATSLVGFNNVLTSYIFGNARVRFGYGTENTDFVPDYSAEIALADDPSALVDHLDVLLAGNQLRDSTKARIVSMVSDISISNDQRQNDLQARVELAIFLTMTTPEYIVQR